MPLSAALDDTLLSDRPSLRRDLSALRHQPPDSPAARRLRQRIEQRLTHSAAVLAARRAVRPPQIAFPDELPISAHLTDIAAALHGHQVVVVCGETGSGKTTQLAKLCLHLGRGLHGRIGHTQPRRLAARAVAARLATELAAPPAVGYSVRFDHTVADAAAIEVMTDGLLLAATRSDPDLLAYDTLIIDEAHERSLNIDFLLGYLHRLLPRRPDLRLIITSATIDPQRFAGHFGDAPIIEVSGRGYPVELRYRPLRTADRDQADISLSEGIVAAVSELQAQGPGDVLVFLPGEREIRDTTDALRAHGADMELLPLYARLSRTDQERVFAPARRRRVVLATNVAETSLTVPGIRYVIDSGLARISRYNARSHVQRLGVEKISRASAQQRAGRCGRLGPGVCIRLYDEEDLAGRPAHTTPEILRASLAGVLLRMHALRLGDALAFPFLDPPPRRQINAARQHLFELGALDATGDLTDLGRQLARFPLDPALGRMLIEASRTGALREVLIICAALAVQDPRERPLEARQKADQQHRQFADPRSDFLTLLNLYRAFTEQARHLSRAKLRAWCRDNYLSYLRLREWRDVLGQLTEQANAMGLRRSDGEADYKAIHRALLSGLLTQVARRPDIPRSRRGRNRGPVTLEGPRGAQLRVFPGSPLARRPPRWLMAAQLVETGQLYARTVAGIEPYWLESAAAHLLRRSYSEPHWDAPSRRPMAFERVTLHGLTLVARRPVAYAPIDPAHARAIFIREALIDGLFDADCPDLAANRRLLQSLETLQAKARRPLLVDEDRLFALYDTRLPPDVWDGHRFMHWLRRAPAGALRLDRADLLRESAADISDRDFPDRLAAGNALLPLHYHFAPGQPYDGVTARIPDTALELLSEPVFDWLIPGWLVEKCTALIRTLPAPLRRACGPAPDAARAALARLTPGRAPLAKALAEVLGELTGEPITADAFHAERLDPHLTFRFEIVDEHGNPLASGRDRLQLRERVAGRESARPVSDTHAIEREPIFADDLTALPEQVTVAGPAGTDWLRWPALVDTGDGCAVRLFDDPGQAGAVHRHGVRALLTRRLADRLPDLPPAAVTAGRRLGTAATLRRDLHLAIIRYLWPDDAEAPRDRAGLEALAARLQADLPAAGERLVHTVTETLLAWQTLRRRLDHGTTLTLLDAAGDVRDQLGRLVYPGFMAGTPPQRLTELPRYLKAAALRLERAQADPAADRDQRQALQVLWQSFWQMDSEHAARPAWQELRWLLEELRVALFAPTLGTPQPVSVARLSRLLVERSA